jgi:RND family efflux transporter MFP subunit
MKKPLILFLLISLIITGCSNGTEAGAENGIESQKEGEVTYVKVSLVETMDFANMLSLPGMLQPKEEVMVTSKVSGTVEKIPVDIGSKVKKGDTLCKIDHTVFQLQYEKAVTALDLERLKSEKAEKGLNIAQIKFDNLEKNYFRIKALFQNQAVSQSEMDNMETQYQMERELLDLAKNDYNMTKGLLALSQNDVKLARENLNYTHITAPISGEVSMKDIFAGENISPGKPIFGVINTVEMYVESGVSEKDIGMISSGQKVLVRVNSLGDNLFEGVITHVGPRPDTMAKTYPIKVLVTNEDSVLKAGMFAAVEIVIESRDKALSVLREAVVVENGNMYVFVEEDGKAVRKAVQLGFSNETHYEIIEGIEEGEKVIVVGQNTLVDGSLVEVR